MPRSDASRGQSPPDNSISRMRPITLGQPIFLAAMEAIIFTPSSLVTAIIMSAVATPASRSFEEDVAFPSTSRTLSSRANFLASSSRSMMVTSCFSAVNTLARSNPISPAPAITIFKKKGFISGWLKLTRFTLSNKVLSCWLSYVKTRSYCHEFRKRSMDCPAKG